MFKRRVALFVLSAALATISLAGCATAGSGKFSWDNARQVKAGMSQQEVVALMGPPYLTQGIGQNGVKLVWVHVNLFAGTESAAMTFKDGKAVDSFHVPESFK